MIKNAEQTELNTQLLELTLYKSFIHTQDASTCVAEFISATVKALSFDNGLLLKKSKDGKWKLSKDNLNLHSFGQGQLDIPKQFVNGLKKDKIVFVENNGLLSGLQSEMAYFTQLFVYLNADYILLILSKTKDTSIQDYSWYLDPCYAFFQHYTSLIKVKKYNDLSDRNSISATPKMTTESVAQEQLLSTVLELSSSSYLVYDKNLEVSYYNDKAFAIHKEFLGISLKLGMHITDIGTQELSFWNETNNRLKLLNENKEFGELYVFHSGDEEIHMSINIKPMLDDAKNVVGYIETATDVTDLTNKSRKKREKISTLSAVLNSTNNSIYAIDRNMVLISINQYAQDDFERFCGRRPVVGDDLNDIIKAETLTAWRERYYDKVLKGEQISFAGVDSSSRVVESVYTPVKDENGEIIACLEVSRDLSELTRSKQALEVRESQLRVLVENVPTGIVRCNEDFKIIDISKRVSEISGYDPEEIINQNLNAIIHRDDKEELERYVNQLKSGNNKQHSTRLMHKDGHILHVEGLGTVISDNNDDKIEYLLTINDVTDKVNIERNLQVTQGNYNRLFKNLHDSVLVFNFDKWELLDYNESFIQLYGSDNFENITIEDILPEKSKFLPDVNLHKEYTHTADAIKSKKKLKFTTVLLDYERNEKLVEVSVFPSDQEDAVAYVIIKDITKLYLSSIDAKQKTAIYEKLISESSEGIDIVEYKLPFDIHDKEFDLKTFKDNTNSHNVIVRNDLMNEYLNNNPASLTTVEQIVDILTPVQLDKTTAHEKAERIILDTIQNRRSSQEIRVDNGKRCYDFYLTQTVIYVNKKLYIIRHLIDITEKIKSENIIQNQIADLNETNSELQKYIDSNLQLENFAYIASHDLKAPIRSVISFMQLLRKNIINKIDEKDLKFIDIVLAASTNMQVLIDDLLDFSRINTQAVVYDEVDINKLLKYLNRDLISTIEESEATITIGAMPTLFADESRLRQLFQNLITNGIKFMDKDGTKPLINIEYKELPNEHLFVVSDNGIGIEAEYLDKIFLMFKKLHSENRYTGTGIGLSICKKVVDQHNGKIWVESELGKGSTFHFTICKELKP
jgi:PAS domain S-box-containing protein